MKNTKFLKAVCKKTGRHFALELAQIGGTWKAVNFLVQTFDVLVCLVITEIISGMPCFFWHFNPLVH